MARRRSIARVSISKMPLVFSARRRGHSAERNRVAITGRFGNRRGEATGGSDRLTPTPFTEVGQVPDFSEIRRELLTFIKDGASSGAFDGGSARYADQWILAKLGIWLERLETEYQLRADSAAWIVAGRLENFTAAYGTLIENERALRQQDVVLERLAAILQGNCAHEHPAPLAAPAPITTIPTLPDLPRASQLRGLDLLPLAVVTTSSPAIQHRTMARLAVNPDDALPSQNEGISSDANHS